MSYEQEMHRFIEQQQKYIQELANTVETMACLTRGLLKAVHESSGDSGVDAVLDTALAAASGMRWSGEARANKVLIKQLCDEAKSAR